MTQRTRLVISGCDGRMGRAIATLALQDSALVVSGALEAKGHETIGKDYGRVLGRSADLGVKVTDDAREVIRQGDVLVEFTSPQATVEHAGLAAELGTPIVIGTTGLSEADRRQIARAAKTVPVLVSPNMSLGVTVLLSLVHAAATQLGAGYDVEVVEAHHREKRDAPSGTAKLLALTLARALGRSEEAIPTHAIRAGRIVGDHTVLFAGPHERLELTHHAQSREAFAEGALRAARFLVGRTPDLYDMFHVLGQTPKAGSPHG